MSIRIVRHMGARSVPADDSKVLLLVPLFPGEKIKHVGMSAYFASGDDSHIDQPSELNWYGITVPWSLVFATPMLNAGAAPGDLGDVADFDQLYAMWLRSASEAADQYWGGDVDVDPEEIAGEEGHTTEELIDSGPIAVFKWFSREVIMQPFAAEGNNVIRFGDSFSGSIKSVPISNMGGIVMFGIVRSEHAAETNFNIELDDAVSKEAMGLLISGDYTKVLSKVQGDTSSLGDYLRTVLYGGDAYIESDTLAGAAGKAAVKAKFAIETRLGRMDTV